MRAIAIDDEPLALQVIATFCATEKDVEFVRGFTQPREALNFLQENEIDIVFLDVQMPAISGIKLAAMLDKSYIVIFTTAYAEYAVRSYDLNALDYLLKPISAERFKKAIQKAREYTQWLNVVPNNESFLYLKSEYRIVKVVLDEITYIEGLADYVKIYCRGQKPILSRIPMKEIITKLPLADFVRVHRSFIVPFKGIESIRNGIIFFAGMQIPIGRTYSKDFLVAFRKFQGR